MLKSLKSQSMVTRTPDPSDSRHVIVCLNPLTYTTSIFRYIALGAYSLSKSELVEQGMAFSIGGFVITPLMGLMITVLIGAVFFVLCVRKFDRADFSTIKVATGMRGGGAPAR